MAPPTRLSRNETSLTLLKQRRINVVLLTQQFLPDTRYTYTFIWFSQVYSLNSNKILSLKCLALKTANQLIAATVKLVLYKKLKTAHWLSGSSTIQKSLAVSIQGMMEQWRKTDKKNGWEESFETGIKFFYDSTSTV